MEEQQNQVNTMIRDNFRQVAAYHPLKRKAPGSVPPAGLRSESGANFFSKRAFTNQLLPSHAFGRIASLAPQAGRLRSQALRVPTTNV